MSPQNKMRDFVYPGTVGTLGFVASISMQEVASVCVAVVTIAALLPVAIARWKKLLDKKDVESKPPFE